MGYEDTFHESELLLEIAKLRQQLVAETARAERAESSLQAIHEHYILVDKTTEESETVFEREIDVGGLTHLIEMRLAKSISGVSILGPPSTPNRKPLSAHFSAGVPSLKTDMKPSERLRG